MGSTKNKNKLYKYLCKNNFINQLKVQEYKNIEINLQKSKQYSKKHTMKTGLKVLLNIHLKFGE